VSNWSRPLAYLAIIAVVAVAYFIGRSGRGDEGVDDAATLPPDPGYAAHDAVVIETGYDGRERYRLNAKVIRQQTESGEIELESLSMDYYPGAQSSATPGAQSSATPGAESTPPANASDEMWHLTSDRGQVRADGDDVELSGNVRVTGPAPGTGQPLVLSTSELRMHTPTEFIETNSPVTINWSGHELNAKGLEADLKQGNLRLKSDIHGKFSQ
jgi:lipopolysaccharide export system protein LptC